MRKILLLAAAMSALSLGAANAATINDPTGDLINGFTDAANAGLDVTKFVVSYDATAQSFTLLALMAGKINTAGTDSYVIGVNTGAGSKHGLFASQGAPNVNFDQALSVFEDGHTTLAGHANLTALISGNQFELVVPLSDLPSTGFTDPTQYGFNLWPKNSANKISDFAPDNAMLTAVPEPATWAMMLMGFGALGFAMRRAGRAQSQTAAI